MTKKTNKRAYVVAFCIAMSSNFGFSVAYAYTSYYVAFQNATRFSNTQLGLLLTVLGIASTVLYLPGGYLADRFSPIKLTVTGLIGAGAIGFLIATFPGYPVMMLLYCAFAVFAILVGWNPQIKVLRMVSTDEDQAKIQTARAFGRTLPILAVSLGGSGLLALLPDRTALQATLCLYGGLAILGAIVAGVAYKPADRGDAGAEAQGISLKGFTSVLKHREVWIIGLIGFSAYTASAGITYLQPYLADIYNLSSATSSMYAVIAKNCALLSAPVLAFLAKKKKTSVTGILGLGLLAALACFVVYLFLPVGSGLLLAAIVLYMLAALSIMGAWALQFVPVSEVGFPLAMTGTAIGVISAFSFVSDIFYSALCGSLIDRFGLAGYQYIFGMTAAVLAAGAWACLHIGKQIRERAKVS